MAERSRIGLCAGKDCRRADGYRSVERELRASCDVVSLACLDVCDGPVVVLRLDSDSPIVVERVEHRAVAAALVDHVTSGAELKGRARKRVLSGTKQAKARRRIVRKR